MKSAGAAVRRFERTTVESSLIRDHYAEARHNQLRLEIVGPFAGHMAPIEDLDELRGADVRLVAWIEEVDDEGRHSYTGQTTFDGLLVSATPAGVMLQTAAIDPDTRAPSYSAGHSVTFPRHTVTAATELVGEGEVPREWFAAPLKPHEVRHARGERPTPWSWWLTLSARWTVAAAAVAGAAVGAVTLAGPRLIVAIAAVVLAMAATMALPHGESLRYPRASRRLEALGMVAAAAAVGLVALAAGNSAGGLAVALAVLYSPPLLLQIQRGRA